MSRSSEVADKIDAHLKRWEADKRGVNRDDRRDGAGCRPYYCAGSWAAGGWVCICYVSYQGVSKVRAEQAEKYLRWIEAGNVGRHYQALRYEARP